MKKIILCFAVISSSQVAARDVSVAVYTGGPAPSFQLIVPSHPRIPEPQGAPSQSNDAASALMAQFTSIEPSTVATLSTTINVPEWMRTGWAGPSPLRAQHFSRRSTSICARPAYRPYVGLSSSGEARRRTYYSEMAAAACEAGVPIELFDSLIVQESRYNPRALSPAGAVGMAQLMPATARALRVSNAWDIRENLKGGARYLRQQLDEFGHWHLALSAYNAGPGNVRRYGGVPPFRETTRYIRSILAGTRSALSTAQGLDVVTERRAAHVSYR